MRSPIKRGKEVWEGGLGSKAAYEASEAAREALEEQAELDQERLQSLEEALDAAGVVGALAVGEPGAELTPSGA